jgi:hypothetical protein
MTTGAAFIRAHNLRAFPIKSGRKKPPCFANNLNLATNDMARLKQWSRDPRWYAPGHPLNWGVSVALSGYVVIDVDEKPGKNGAATFERIGLLHGGWPRTLTVRSPSGGHHLYYRQTNAVRFVTGKQDIFGPESHIDAPGYVLTAGSVLDASNEYPGPYTIEDDAPIALAPDWLAGYLGHTERRSTDQTPVVELDQDINVEWAMHHLQHNAKVCIQGRGGEYTLLLLAGVLKDHGISEWMACQLLDESGYNAKCQPPWNLGNDGELADRLGVKVANAYCYLKQVRPGAATAEADFGSDESEPDHSDLIAWWQKFDAQPEQVRRRHERAEWNAARARVTIPDRDRKPQR